MKYKKNKDKRFQNRGFNFRQKKFLKSKIGRDFSKFISKEVKSSQIQEITEKNFDEKIELIGIIEKIVQTGGPTLFVFNDGSGTLFLKGFIGPGERAYPEIHENDSVKVIITIKEFNNELEGEINKITKLNATEHQILLNKIKDLQKKRAKVNETEFLVKSVILDKLKEKMYLAAFEIKLAIIQNRPIIIRHHNDTDGYSAGYSLEKGIIPLIEKEHNSEKASWEFFLRSPSMAPFYEIDDSIKDTALSLRNVAKFSNKMPLVIIADNGSSPEDLFAIKQGKVHEMDFIVIDHHFFDIDVISREVLVHINPFLVGEDGTKFSAGMLCTELARLINDVSGIEPIPALAGFADRIELTNPSLMQDYLKIAEKEGYTEELLSDISAVIDFVSAKLRFLEAREYIGVIFGEPRHKQKQLVSLMAPYIRKLEEKGLLIAKSNYKKEKVQKTTLILLDIENTFPGFGFYPKPGKCVGLLHDYIIKHENTTNLITIGLMNTAMTIRATDEANFSMHEFISYLTKNSPNSFVEGGGHKNAGSITFIPNKQKEIIELLKIFLTERNSNI
jgi:RecJ-like exonuclease